MIEIYWVVLDFYTSFECFFLSFVVLPNEDFLEMPLLACLKIS